MITLFSHTHHLLSRPKVSPLGSHKIFACACLLPLNPHILYILLISLCCYKDHSKMYFLETAWLWLTWASKAAQKMNVLPVIHF
jgi:hypothetical protein